MKSYSSTQIFRMLKKDGWYHVSTVGDHHHFKHPTKPGKITVTHPVKDIPTKTALCILKLAGLKPN